MNAVNFCRKLAVFFVAALILAAAPARAELVVDVTRGFVEPLPVAVTDFFGETPEEIKVGRDIAGVIAANLEAAACSGRSTRAPSSRIRPLCAPGRALATGA